MLQLIYLQCIIKIRGVPIDGCPGEKLNELFEKPPFSSAKSIGVFSRESFPASPIFGLRLLGDDSFFVIIPPLTQEKHKEK